MENVTVLWNNTNGTEFERSIPLLWSGKRNVKLGFKNNINILFLNGYNQLGKGYIASLENIGYGVHDVAGIYERYAAKYNQLNRFGDYGKKCFLRWLVIRDFFNKSSFIHYDGDILFNDSPEHLGEALGKYTFVLQGCPAFVSVHDTIWLDKYENALGKFVNDLEGYSAMAWEQRKGWEESFKIKWAGSRYAEVISSDQDLISHLIHTDQLPQTAPDIVKAAVPGVMLIENPLYLFSHHEGMLPLKYTRVNSVDYFNGEKVGFWHIQSYFAHYLSQVYFRKCFLNVPLRVPNLLEPMQKIDKVISTSFRIASRLIRGKSNRIDLYRYFFEENDLSAVFNNAIFWKKVFTK
ncbi:MAG: hypothetical protein A2270_07320 [Elusimicrobia bacterium RIFOXYA12_FULL_51_18]|nr:MAG: hypothetical protein A2270_07320 [Elusimicrobia bacterium RIFOXYA12_FULL_51_18]OGS28492.1 MAG: hypothetical protein A2218_05625 [Elusimicrobia bacterium RIFOXYA2_FULL_53_38]